MQQAARILSRNKINKNFSTSQTKRKRVKCKMLASPVQRPSPEVNRFSAIYCNMKCSKKNVKLRGIFHVVSCFPLYFLLYHGNLNNFLGGLKKYIFDNVAVDKVAL